MKLHSIKSNELNMNSLPLVPFSTPSGVNSRFPEWKPNYAITTNMLLAVELVQTDHSKTDRACRVKEKVVAIYGVSTIAEVRKQKFLYGFGPQKMALFSKP